MAAQKTKENNDTKKKKKTLLTEDVKKKNHIESEHRRRNMMKEKHNRLISLVPKLNINHFVYKSSIERIRNICSADGEVQQLNDEEHKAHDQNNFNPDLEFVFQNSSRNNNPEKQLEILQQAIHAERSIYKLTGEYLIEENTKNTQLKMFLRFLLDNGHLSEDLDKHNEVLKLLG
mgnify:CR=1 FL=1